MKRHQTAFMLLGTLFSVALVYFVVIPTWDIWCIRWRVIDAVNNATTVRLEEYSHSVAISSNHVLSATELSGSQKGEIIKALPVTLQVGCPGIIARCFDPHHRLVIHEGESGDVILWICFGCTQVRVSGGAIQPMPARWEKNIRVLLQSNNVDVKTELAYAKIDSDLLNQDTEPPSLRSRIYIDGQAR